MADIDTRSADSLLSPVWTDAQEVIDDIPRAFARNVRKRREVLDVPQELIASLLRFYGLDSWRQTTLAKVESGQRAVKLNEAFALAALYEISLDALLRGEGIEDVDSEAVRVRLMRRYHPMWRGGSSRGKQ